MSYEGNYATETATILGIEHFWTRTILSPWWMRGATSLNYSDSFPFLPHLFCVAFHLHPVLSRSSDGRAHAGSFRRPWSLTFELHRTRRGASEESLLKPSWEQALAWLRSSFGDHLDRWLQGSILLPRWRCCERHWIDERWAWTDVFALGSSHFASRESSPCEIVLAYFSPFHCPSMWTQWNFRPSH